MSHQHLYHEAQILLAQKKSAEAAHLLKQCLCQAPQIWHYHFNYARALLALGNLHSCLFHCQQALALSPDQPEVKTILITVQERLQKRQSLPGICFNSLHRSGTLYIHRTLAQGLDLEPVHISASVPVQYNVLILQLTERLSQGGAISQDHFLPSKLNLWTLNKYIDRLVIHIRDPRQAMLSSAIQMDEYRKKFPEILNYEQFSNFWSQTNQRNTSTLSFEQRLDEMVNNDFIAWVEFIDSWVQASTSFPLKILFTNHQDLKDQPEQFFKQILNFYNISFEKFTFPTEKPSLSGSIMSHNPDFNSANIHFRKGEPNEWETVYTPHQQTRMRDMIPPYLFTRFGWKS